MESTPTRLFALEKELLPSKKQTKEALGNNEKDISDPRSRLVFSNDIISDRFEYMTIEDEDDWIPWVKNKAQSYYAYVKSNPNKLYEERKTIYILALDKGISPSFLQNCKDYCAAFYFVIPVEILANIDVSELSVKSRINDGKLQYNAKEILRKVKKKLPSDAYAMIWVLNKDIYSREAWNWVFGYADLKARVGVFSFARYDPTFFGDSHTMEPEEVEDVIQFRGIKVMCHEIGHMFGLKHWVYYKCIMNGSMSSEEALRKPWYLCPICLKKLYYILRCDIVSTLTTIIQNLIIEKV